MVETFTPLLPSGGWKQVRMVRLNAAYTLSLCSGRLDDSDAN